MTEAITKDAVPKAVKDTVFLPKTDFPMRAGLAQKEPEILKKWQDGDLYGQILKTGVVEGRKSFLLHDGPPYANGNIHIGHATNKILKDVVNRAAFMNGASISFVPGWDCHGLPIEWKIEEQYRARGIDKDTIPVLDFRAECRAFAQHWVEIQSAEFQRLGVVGDWSNPYLTMTHAAEATIVDEIHQFARNGGLYQGVRPVMWSVVEKTALADAEVEYHEHKSTQVWVRFPVVTSPRPELAGAAVVIWTTTPWTLPGNRAVAAGAEMAYGIYQVTAILEDSALKIGDRLVLSETLAEGLMAGLKIAGWDKLARLNGADMLGTICAHPLRGHGYDFDVPLLNGDFVTADAGTGFVHIAPGHGADDFKLGKAHGIEIPRTVADDGSYYQHVPHFAGKRVLTAEGKEGDANGAVIGALKTVGHLLNKGSLRHQYPHSWRSRAPLIFRTTPQWFISMETNGLRDAALAAIEDTKFIPPAGKNRLSAMVADRPDWCISRQRAWGVPIALFVSKETGKVLQDAAVYARIVAAFRQHGADAWYQFPASHFLGDTHKPEDFEQVFDIADVWFESGATHVFVSAQRGLGDGSGVADLYLEGSDQHRGWFQSSLLESCGTRGHAPYRTVLTHGFVLDEQGRKMSKSVGNVIAPQKVIDQYGADILRLWVVGGDYSDDVRIGGDILKQHAESYRRIRNSLRYLLGSLAGFTPQEEVKLHDLPELEQAMLHRLHEVGTQVAESVAGFDYHRLSSLLHHFCAVDLSAFYVDIRKDSLYCDAPESPRRRACRTVLAEIFSCLTAWLAPILCFTAEEAWEHRPYKRPGEPDSVHLRRFPELPSAWHNPALAEKWNRLRDIRRVVTGALEIERAEKRIGASLQAAPIVYVADETDAAMLYSIDFADLCITSSIQIDHGTAPENAFHLGDVKGIAVTSRLAEGEKCERCWKILPEVRYHDHLDGAVCSRCAGAVENHQKAA